jgi:hypothetical protein
MIGIVRGLPFATVVQMAGGDTAAEAAAALFAIAGTCLSLPSSRCLELDYELGATSLSSGGVNWRVYADPAGKPVFLRWD